jgi:hypothetical protein
MTYRAQFTGRLAGAIGIFHPITTTVEGDDPAAARLALYDRFEHITGLTLTPICGDVCPGTTDSRCTAARDHIGAHRDAHGRSWA